MPDQSRRCPELQPGLTSIMTMTRERCPQLAGHEPGPHGDNRMGWWPVANPEPAGPDESDEQDMWATLAVLVDEHDPQQLREALEAQISDRRPGHPATPADPADPDPIRLPAAGYGPRGTDWAPGLIEGLTRLTDDYGARGVLIAVEQLYPGARPADPDDATAITITGIDVRVVPVPPTLGQLARRVGRLVSRELHGTVEDEDFVALRQLHDQWVLAGRPEHRPDPEEAEA